MVGRCLGTLSHEPLPGRALFWPGLSAAAAEQLVVLAVAAGHAASDEPSRSRSRSTAPPERDDHPQGVAGEPDVVEYVRQAQAGSSAAFGWLYQHYADQVYAYTYHRVGRRQLAEDLVGDVFERALARIGTFRWKGVDFGAWLLTIARNRINDYYRSARFRLESDIEYDFSTTPEEGATPEELTLANDRARQVRAALGRLRNNQAEVLYLRFILGLGVAETAAIIGKSNGSTRELQCRALKSLSKHLPRGLSPLVGENV